MGNLSKPGRSGSRLTAATATAAAAITFAPFARAEDPAAYRDFKHSRFDAIPSFVTPQGPQESRTNSQPIPPATTETRRQIADRAGTGIGNGNIDISTGTDSGHNRNHKAARGRILGPTSRYRLSVEGDRSVHPAVSKLSGASRPGKPGVETVIAEVLDEIGHLAMHIKSQEDQRVKMAIRYAIQRILHGDKDYHFTEADHKVEVMNNLREILDLLEMGTHYSYDRKSRQATLKPVSEDSVQSLFSATPNIERALTARHIYEYLLTHLERGVHYEIVKIKNVKGAGIALTEEGKSEVRALTGGLNVENIERVLHHYEALREKGLPRKQAAAEVSKEFAAKAAFANPFQEVVEIPIDLKATIKALIKEHAIDYVPDYDAETVALTERGIGQACHYLKVGALEELGKNAQAQIEQAIAEVKFKEQDETWTEQPKYETATEAQEALKAKVEAAERLARLVKRAVKEALRESSIARRAARRKGSKAVFPIDDEYGTAEEQEEQPADDAQEDDGADIDRGAEYEWRLDSRYPEAFDPNDPLNHAEETQKEQPAEEISVTAEGNPDENDDYADDYADEIAATGNGSEKPADQTAPSYGQKLGLRAVYPEAFDPKHPQNLKPNGAGARPHFDYEGLDIPPSAHRREVRAALKPFN